MSGLPPTRHTQRAHTIAQAIADGGHREQSQGGSQRHQEGPIRCVVSPVGCPGRGAGTVAPSHAAPELAAAAGTQTTQLLQTTPTTLLRPAVQPTAPTTTTRGPRGAHEHACTGDNELLQYSSTGRHAFARRARRGGGGGGWCGGNGVAVFHHGPYVHGPTLPGGCAHPHFTTPRRGWSLQTLRCAVPLPLKNCKAPTVRLLGHLRTGLRHGDAAAAKSSCENDRSAAGTFSFQFDGSVMSARDGSAVSMDGSPSLRG
jgi:hypothetical protein